MSKALQETGTGRVFVNFKLNFFKSLLLLLRPKRRSLSVYCWGNQANAMIPRDQSLVSNAKTKWHNFDSCEAVLHISWGEHPCICDMRHLENSNARISLIWGTVRQTGAWACVRKRWLTWLLLHWRQVKCIQIGELMTCVEFTACPLQVDTKQLRELVQISCQEQMCSTELIWHATGPGLSRGDLSCTSQHHAVQGMPALHRSWITPRAPDYCGLQSSSTWPGSVKAAQEHLDLTTVLAVMGTD